MNNFQIDKNPTDPTLYEIDITPIYNPFNSSELFMIFKDFKLIEKNCANVLLKDIEEIPYYTLTCTFAGNNLVIFHYPKSKYKEKLNNKNYICVISTIIDEKNNLRNDYLLKYNDKNSYKSHIEEIKKDLSGYLDTVPFVNNTAPIVVNEYIEIGVIIKIYDNALIPFSNAFQSVNKNQVEKINKENYMDEFFTKDGEKIIAVNFISMAFNEIANYNLICKENDLFLSLEKRLYKEFPQIKNKVFFMCDAKIIDKNKTLKENGIKNNSLVSIFINGE